MTTTHAPANFEDYVTARWPAFYRTAHLLTADAATAEDLLQTTLLKVMGHWPRVRRADSPDAYVRKMLLNEFLGDRRKAARRASKNHLVPLPSAGADFDAASADRLDLWRDVNTLPPRQRAVLVLRYYEDLTEAEIADVLGISPGTVKSQSSRALAALRARRDGPATPAAPAEEASP